MAILNVFSIPGDPTSAIVKRFVPVSRAYVMANSQDELDPKIRTCDSVEVYNEKSKNLKKYGKFTTNLSDGTLLEFMGN